MKKKQDSVRFRTQRQKGETKQRCLARTSIDPLVRSAFTIDDYAPLPDGADLNILVTELEDQASAIKGGNLDRIEDMLIAQTHTLDAVANYMFQCVTRADTMSKVETYMKFGLRAQSQCRSNAEAIANMKNPRTHLNQTNIGYNQQVNNVQSKLLEEKDGERLDFGKAATPIRGDQDVEAVGTKHRAKDA